MEPNYDFDVVKDGGGLAYRAALKEAFNTPGKVVPVPNTVEGVLHSRQQTYGVFANNAGVAQAIKAALHTDRFRSLSPDKQEALDQIASKISRIVTANASEYKDSWTDIQGYAKLVADTLND